MQKMKTTITLGIIGGKDVVLKNPSGDATEHIDFIRKLTLDGGKIESGKTGRQVEQAVVLHTVKGVLKRRSF
jgi:hypothetical protein